MDYYRSRSDIEKKHYTTLANLAKSDLMAVARIVSSRHIKDIFIKEKFLHEISKFADDRIATIKNAKNSAECNIVLDCLKKETDHISKQGTLLSMQSAKVFITVSMEKHKNELGYVIQSIGMILNGLQIYGGIRISSKAGFIIGKIAGAHIAISGASSFTEKIAKLLGKEEYTGFMEQGYQISAEFLGFNKKVGSLTYQIADMSTSLYGLGILSLKGDTFRLFKYIPSDYYRSFTRMSKTAITLKFLGAANKVRVISNITKEMD